MLEVGISGSELCFQLELTVVSVETVQNCPQLWLSCQHFCCIQCPIYNIFISLSLLIGLCYIEVLCLKRYAQFSVFPLWMLMLHLFHFTYLCCTCCGIITVLLAHFLFLETRFRYTCLTLTSLSWCDMNMILSQPWSEYHSFVKTASILIEITWYDSLLAVFIFMWSFL